MPVNTAGVSAFAQTDRREAVRSVRVGMEIAELLLKKYPGSTFEVTKTIVLVGNQSTVDQLKARNTSRADYSWMECRTDSI